jgi:hypothetical protein
MSLHLTIQTLQHVPLLNVCAALPDSFYDVIMEHLADSDLSWGSNANTFAHKGHIRNVIENAWDNWREEQEEDPEVLGSVAAYQDTLAALDALPSDVFVSMGC